MSLFNKNQSLTNRNEQNPISSWQREMNGLMDRFNRELGTFGFGSRDSELGDFSPRIEVQEKEKGYLVCAEIPGMKENEINVTLKDNSLILEGERKSESKTENDNYYRSEFSYGSFYRSVPLDDEVNPDSVKASYKDGILKIEMDKLNPTSHTAKKIPIMNS